VLNHPTFNSLRTVGNFCHQGQDFVIKSADVAKTCGHVLKGLQDFGVGHVGAMT
jgi:hypothetical protein